MITTTTINDKLEIVQVKNYCVLQVRTATIVSDDGTEIARTYSRRMITPDADTSSEPADIKSITDVIFTQTVKNNYLASL